MLEGGGQGAGEFGSEGCFALQRDSFGLSRTFWNRADFLVCLLLFADDVGVSVGHAPSQGKERSYFTNVVHNI